MKLILIASLILPLFISLRLLRSAVNPVSLFLIWWAGWLLLFEFYDFGLYEVSVETMALLVGSVHGFAGGFLWVAANRSMVRLQGEASPHAHRVWEWLAFTRAGRVTSYLCLVIVFGFLYLGARETYSSLSHLSGVALRAEYFETGGASAYGGVYAALIRDLVAKPLCFVLLGLAFLRLVIASPRLSDYGIFFGSFGCLVVLDLAAMARNQVVAGVFFVGLALLFVLLERQKSGLENLRIRRAATLFAGLLVTSIAYVQFVSVERMAASLISDFDRLAVYWTVGFKLFDLRDQVLPRDFDGFVYSLGGLQQIMNLLLRRVDESLQISKTMDLQPFLAVGVGQYGNALFTWCIAFYADLGVFGVIIAPTIFGVIVAQAFIRWRRHRDGAALLYFCYLEFVALAGVQEWRLMWMDQVLVLVFLAFLGKMVVYSRIGEMRQQGLWPRDFGNR